MADFTDAEFRVSMQWILVLAGLFFLFFPHGCTASTLPAQPSLLFEISDPSPGQNTNLTLSVTWQGYVSFNKPPEQIIVGVFSVPDGSRLGSFPIPKTDICQSEKTCMCLTSVEVRAFPSGTFMLVTADPLSGATDRKMISIPLNSTGNTEFFKRYEHEQMFFGNFRTPWSISCICPCDPDQGEYLIIGIRSICRPDKGSSRKEHLYNDPGN